MTIKKNKTFAFIKNFFKKSAVFIKTLPNKKGVKKTMKLTNS